MIRQPFYDSNLDFNVNFDKGPYGAFRNSKRIKTSEAPKYTFLGYQINFPFGIPAGPLPNNKFIKGAFDLGFDVNCYKTQRSVEFKCNPFPQVVYVNVDGNLTLKKASKPLLAVKNPKNKKHFTITNSFGNPSRGPKFWTKDLKKALSNEGRGQLLMMSVVGTIKKGFTEEDYFDDFAKTAHLAAKTGVKVIEVNLSCPNVATEGVICYRPDAVSAICIKIKSKIGKTPLVAKLGYFSKDQEKILKEILLKNISNIAAYSAINTISAPVVDKGGKQALPGEGRLKSGMCGASIKWAGVDMVKRLVRLREELGLNYEIIGVGGVMDAKDFKDYRKAGADLVQSATAAMWNPLLAQEIKKAVE